MFSEVLPTAAPHPAHSLTCWERPLPLPLLRSRLSQVGPSTGQRPHPPALVLGCCRGLPGVPLDRMGPWCQAWYRPLRGPDEDLGPSLLSPLTSRRVSRAFSSAFPHPQAGLHCEVGKGPRGGVQTPCRSGCAWGLVERQYPSHISSLPEASGTEVLSRDCDSGRGCSRPQSHIPG